MWMHFRIVPEQQWTMLSLPLKLYNLCRRNWTLYRVRRGLHDEYSYRWSLRVQRKYLSLCKWGLRWSNHLSYCLVCLEHKCVHQLPLVLHCLFTDLRPVFRLPEQSSFEVNKHLWLCQQHFRF